jgi:hypothetical protein
MHSLGFLRRTFTVVPAAEVARCLIGAAQCGSIEAQKWMLDRCAPARKRGVVVLDDYSGIRGAENIAPALAAIAAGVADGVVVSIDEAAVAVNLLQKFLDVLETAHRLGRGLSPVDESQ